MPEYTKVTVRYGDARNDYASDYESYGKRFFEAIESAIQCFQVLSKQNNYILNLSLKLAFSKKQALP